MPDRITLFIGAYGSGIRPLDWRPDDDAWSLRDPLPDTDNASYGTYGSRYGLHYLINEQDNGRLSVYDRNWRKRAEVPSGGAEPCFVALNADETILGVANYKSGSVAFYRLGDGVPAGAADIRTHQGFGPNSERQDGPHAHCVRFRGPLAYSTDLGTDEILAHTPEATFVAAKLPPGQGPRHILFHPCLPLAYLLTELGSRLYLLRVESDGHLTLLHGLPTRPSSFDGENLGGHVELNQDATRLYVSNRGHDSLTVFSVGEDGMITLLANVPAGAESPRHFRLLEADRRLVVAHQDGNAITIHTLDDEGIPVLTTQRFTIEQPGFVGLAPMAEVDREDAVETALNLEAH